MAVTIQIRRDLAANWTALNPVLAQGELGLEYDTAKLKIGDGSTAWTDLDYWGGSGGGSGTVTSVAVESANGFAGTVADDTTTPQITIETTVTGLLKGNGTAISEAVEGTDYLTPGGSGAALTGITAEQAGADASGAAAAAESAAKAASVPIDGGTMTGWLAPAVVALTESDSAVAIDAAAGNDFRITLTASGWTISNPASPADGQTICLQLTQDSAGSRTVDWDTEYDFGTAGTPTLTTTEGATDLIIAKYNVTLTKWLATCALGF